MSKETVELVVVMSDEQETTLRGLVGTVVALESAEKAFDVSAKSLISVFGEMFEAIDKSKGNMAARAKAVESSMLTFISTIEMSDGAETRSKGVVTTVSGAISKGIILKTDLIPFTLMQKVIKLVLSGHISKKEITAISKLDDTKYAKGLQDLCTKGDYKALVGSVDYSMLDEDLITLVQGLDKGALTGLSGLIKVVVGA